MRRCCVTGCRSNFTKPYVSVFVFPKNPVVCKLWLKSIGKPEMKVNENIGVCIKHFEEHLIMGINGADGNRKKVCIKQGAVPTIFEDVHTSAISIRRKEKKAPPDKLHRVQSKKSKISLSSTSDIEILSSPTKSEDETKQLKKSPKKVSLTTDRPIIAVIKAQDKSPEKMQEDSESVSEQPNSKDEPFSLPSPYKNLPTVSVCLKEEDRVPITRELKGIKRSPSTGSNSSSGSADVQKAAVVKRRKVEKPAPVVIGRQNDCYCWVCHRENVILTCIACPRAYHYKCAGEISGVSSDWVCPECQRILAAENVDTRSSTLADISLDRLCALLKLSLNKMKQRAPIAFHQPVSLDHYPLYLHYVINPMDFSLIEKNIKQQIYGCTEAFLADVKWIAHNSCVFNGTQHPLSTNAKNIVKSCDQDMQEIEVCPDCFVHSIVRNKYWFSEVCRKPHPLVWAKLKGFPYWPAKVVRINNGNVDARFFGAHDRAWVPISQCYHLSKEMPTTSKPKKKGNYEIALDELNVHVHILIQKFGSFEYAAYRTSFNPANPYLLYHGIDISKAAKEDISFDASVASPSKMRFPSPEKESRFSRMMESESEQCNNSEEVPQEDNQSDSASSNVMQLHEKTSLINRTFLFKESKTDESSTTEKGTLLESSAVKIDDKSDSAVPSSNNKPSVNSDSDQLDQLRKLELALERIKGYVSLNVDSEKENEEVSEIEEKKSEEESKSLSPIDENKEKKRDEILSSLFKKTIKLPDIEPNVPEPVENVNVPLETTKKTDSFFLKLNETIESCKAKLGISEITDDIPSDNESVGNASKSDDDDEDEEEDDDNDENSSTSDDENSSLSEDEENSSVNEEAEDENEITEDENEVENGENEDSSECKIVEKSNTKNTDSEFDENSNSELSDTDIEANDATCKDHDKSDIRENPDYEDSVKDYSDNLDSPSDLEIDTSEKNADSAANLIKPLEKGHSNYPSDKAESDINSLNDNPVRIAENEQEMSEPNKCQFESNNNNNNSMLTDVSKNLEQMKKVQNLSDQNANLSTNLKTSTNISKTDLPTALKLGESINEHQQLNSEKLLPNKIPTESIASKHDEDDDIYICNSPVKKAPPVIVLDDEDNDEENPLSDTCAIRTPPYSTSAESFSNEENSKQNSENTDSSAGKSIITNGNITKETLAEDSKPELMKRLNFSKIDNSNDERSSARKRPITTADTSDDEVQFLQPARKITRTGAIRTFNKSNNTHNSNFASPVKMPENERENFVNSISASPGSETSANTDKSPDGLRQALSQLSPIADISQLSDQEKHIILLTKKLNCVVTAYRLQTWKNVQEKDELRHNMNLVMMEMRQCFESDKKQAIEALSLKFEKEKHKIIEETKRKQWCASCSLESQYACCWNTSYCSYLCQKRHFPTHRKICTQVKKKFYEVSEVKSKPSHNTSDGGENKNKILILNMKSQDASKPSTSIPSSVTNQQIPLNKPQIQMLSSKPQVQLPVIVSAPSPAQPLQFYISQEKSQTTPATVVTSSVANKEMDTSTIIDGVRSKKCDLNTAISLIKKKNQESSLTFLKKKVESKEEKKENPQKEESNLEERYFPSPPTITFEDYESVSPEPNLVIEEPFEDDKTNSEEIDDGSDNYDGVNPEKDIEISDSEDVDNEMVNIGRGIEVKAKFLNKCLIYGTSAKKLTRCLVDVIFPDLKLLASCSAFGQKSNVTKLTRCALPARKVYAIIDFVSRRFPGATRSAIVLVINMKCKEARVIVNKQDELSKKLSSRRSLAKEKESESTPVTSLPVPSTPVVTSPTVASPKIVPNVVCVKTTNNSHAVAPSFNLPMKSVTVTSPNILRCAPQLVIKPKPILNTLGTAAYVSSPKTKCVNIAKKKPETVRNLLANKMNWPRNHVNNDGKLLIPLEPLKTTTSNTTQPVSTSPSTSRPLIIIGSSSLKPPLQHPALPATSAVKK